VSHTVLWLKAALLLSGNTPTELKPIYDQGGKMIKPMSAHVRPEFAEPQRANLGAVEEARKMRTLGVRHRIASGVFVIATRVHSAAAASFMLRHRRPRRRYHPVLVFSSQAHRSLSVPFSKNLH
jgi:hypothetical protein